MAIIRTTPPEPMSARWVEMIHFVLAFGDVRPICDCQHGDCQNDYPPHLGNIMLCRHGRVVARNETNSDLPY